MPEEDLRVEHDVLRRGISALRGEVRGERHAAGLVSNYETDKGERAISHEGFDGGFPFNRFITDAEVADKHPLGGDADVAVSGDNVAFKYRLAFTFRFAFGPGLKTEFHSEALRLCRQEATAGTGAAD